MQIQSLPPTRTPSKKADRRPCASLRPTPLLLVLLAQRPWQCQPQVQRTVMPPSQGQPQVRTLLMLMSTARATIL